MYKLKCEKTKLVFTDEEFNNEIKKLLIISKKNKKCF